MPNYAVTLDDLFSAMANPTRRGVIERLTRGPAATTELAKPFPMALPSFLEHLTILERTGLVTSAKKGRTRVYRLRHQAIAEAEGWLWARRREWEDRLDRLDSFLAQEQDQNR